MMIVLYSTVGQALHKGICSMCMQLTETTRPCTAHILCIQRTIVLTCILPRFRRAYFQCAYCTYQWSYKFQICLHELSLEGVWSLQGASTSNAKQVHARPVSCPSTSVIIAKNNLRYNGREAVICWNSAACKHPRDLKVYAHVCLLSNQFFFMMLFFRMESKRAALKYGLWPSDTPSSNYSSCICQAIAPTAMDHRNQGPPLPSTPGLPTPPLISAPGIPSIGGSFCCRSDSWQNIDVSICLQFSSGATGYPNRRMRSPISIRCSNRIWIATSLRSRINLTLGRYSRISVQRQHHMLPLPLQPSPYIAAKQKCHDELTPCRRQSLQPLFLYQATCLSGSAILG